jgi:hypothetical protein
MDGGGGRGFGARVASWRKAVPYVVGARVSTPPHTASIRDAEVLSEAYRGL